jgi:hypothetical protein
VVAAPNTIGTPGIAWAVVYTATHSDDCIGCRGRNGEQEWSRYSYQAVAESVAHRMMTDDSWARLHCQNIRVVEVRERRDR